MDRDLMDVDEIHEKLVQLCKEHNWLADEYHFNIDTVTPTSLKMVGATINGMLNCCRGRTDAKAQALVLSLANLNNHLSVIKLSVCPVCDPTA